MEYFNNLYENNVSRKDILSEKFDNNSKEKLKFEALKTVSRVIRKENKDLKLRILELELKVFYSYLIQF